ncbi:DUF6023 family protein [Actinorhabdospora filicis]|nr:DUF6023 family protein [Actinorhabdospora filicis]
MAKTILTAATATAAATLLLTACGTGDPKNPAAPAPPQEPSTKATDLTEEQWNAYRDTAERKLPATDEQALWKGTVGGGTDYASETTFPKGGYVLDLVCVGEGEAYIELTLASAAVTTSVPCSTAGIVTSKDLTVEKAGGLKVSGGKTTEGRGKNVLVGRLTEK